ncbi:MAG: DsrE family protein [Gammaproteobacteria bacterium]|nr:DsrE family protein [Gammaproteobacteria bacterium]
MKNVRNMLAVVLAATLTIILLLWATGGSTPRPPAPVTPQPAAAPAPLTAPAPATSDPRGDAAATATGPIGADIAHYYFDVVGHDAAEFRALLERADMIFEQTPPPERPRLRVVLVLHGPDVEYFDLRQRERYPGLLELAARLDALGVFDFKVCTVSAEQRELDADALPAFVELVPYAPEEIARLEAAGFVRL